MQTSEILKAFCELDENEKEIQLADYLNQLHRVYDPDEPILELPAGCFPGLETAGGKLLSQFIQAHPLLQELHLVWHGLSEEGFHFLMDGLVKTKEQSALRILVISNETLCETVLKPLAQAVLSHHPSLKTLKLESAGLKDNHIDILLTHTINSSVREMYLFGNQLEGKVFLGKEEKLFYAYPQLQWIDLNTNPIRKETHLTALVQLLETHRQLFIRFPTSKNIQSLSLRNHYQSFLPNHLQFMVNELNRLSLLFDQFSLKMQQLPEFPTTEQVQEKFIQIEKQLKLTNERIEKDTEARTILEERLMHQEVVEAAHYLEQRCAITTLEQRQENVELTAKEALSCIKSTMVSLDEVDSRLQSLEVKEKASTEVVKNLNAITRQHAHRFKEIDAHIDSLKHAAEALAQQWQQERHRLTDIIDTRLALPTEPLNPLEKLYVKMFTKTVVAMYSAARAVTTGVVSGNATNSMLVQVLKAAGHIAPIGGVGFHLLAALVNKVNQALQLQRMRRLNKLGVYEQEVVELSMALSRRLVKHLSIENPVQNTFLSQLLGLVENLFSEEVDLENSQPETIIQTEAFVLYQTLGESIVTKKIYEFYSKNDEQSHDEQSIEKRAEQDANIFLTMVAKNDVPQSVLMREARLFLYAFPLLAVVDRLYWRMLFLFCERENRVHHKTLSPDQLTLNSDKKKKFLARVASSWQTQAPVTAPYLHHKADFFVDKMAETFNETRHVDERYGSAIGVFFFKPKETRTSWYNGLVDSQKAIDDVVGKVTKTLPALVL